MRIRTGEIALLHVHPAHRRRGIGGALLEAATDHPTSLGIRTWLPRGRVAVVLPA